jgi:hypothetical protein
MTQRRQTDFTARPGGVMTDEVGVITGDLTLVTELSDDGSLVQRVQYKDADEWYVVTDSPRALPAGSDIDAVHTATVAQLSGGSEPA